MKCSACQVELHSAFGEPHSWEIFFLCSECFALPKAVTLLVSRDGLYLAVSRKYDHTQFGLPGGKIDPGETSLQAIYRELDEETGLGMAECSLAFIGVCPGGRDGQAYVNVAYLSEAVNGDIKTNEPHVVAWVSEQTLLDGPFGHFNRRLLRSIGREA